MSCPEFRAQEAPNSVLAARDAAVGAFAQPLGVHGAAIAAEEEGFGFGLGHGRIVAENGGGVLKTPNVALFGARGDVCGLKMTGMNLENNDRSIGGDAVIHLEIVYQVEDLLDHKGGPLHERIAWRWHQLLLWAVIIGAAAGVFVIFGSPGHREEVRSRSVGEMLSSAAIPVIAIVGFMTYTAALKRRARKAFAGVTPTPVNIWLSRQDFQWEVGGKRAVAAWTAFRSAGESARNFFIMPLKGNQVILPKRVMTLEQVGAIRQLLQESVTDHRGFPVQVQGPEKAERTGG
jgi:YcxB-like protein